MKYRPEIDGLRALAVVPVILFHAGIEPFSGGFVGVDVFFVISGYLITTIIINDLSGDKFSIINFYERRARRILPALFFVVLVCLPFAWFSLIPSDLKAFGASLAAVATFSSNILFWLESGYFDTAAELKPMLHTWSLAVEEQYYILFPIFLLATWKLGVRWAVLLSVALFIVSLGIAHWATNFSPRPKVVSGAFFLLPARGWELLIGVFAAFYLKYFGYLKSNPINQGLSLIGFAMVIGSIFVFDRTTPFPSLYALLPTLGTGLIIVSATPATIINRTLSIAPIVGIGLISYSAYLWHQPIFVFARYNLSAEPSTVLLLIFSAASLLFAYISWRYVEKPFRDKRKTSRNFIFGFSAAGMLIFTLIGLFTYSQNGFESIKYADLNRWLASQGNDSFEHDNYVLQEKSWETLRSLADNQEYSVTGNQFDNELWFDLSDDSRVKMLLVGNSHSNDLFNVLNFSPELRERFQLARYGVQIGSLKEEFYSTPNYQHAETIMIVSRYGDFDIKRLPGIIDRMQADAKKVYLVSEIFRYPSIAGVTTADVIIQKEFSRTNSLAELAERVNSDFTKLYNEGYVGQEFDHWKSTTAEIVRIASTDDDLTVLDRMDYVCPDEICLSVDEDLTKLFSDGQHHTLYGAKFFGQNLDTTKFYQQLVSGSGG